MRLIIFTLFPIFFYSPNHTKNVNDPRIWFFADVNMELNYFYLFKQHDFIS